MSEDAWRNLDTVLEGGPPARFWLRDDDAKAVTPALVRLEDLCTAAGAHLLMAVIPAAADSALGTWARGRALVTPCQHGYAHRNHAAPGERACELGGDRADSAVLAELRAGHAAMNAVFDAAWLPVLVPPWNRIRDSLLIALPDLGFCAVSTFASTAPRRTEGLPSLDCDLDIIDWRNGRRGRKAEDLCGRLATLVTSARDHGRSIGLLTHHLAHDDACWSFLGRLLPMLANHRGAQFTNAADELARQANGQ